MCNIRRFYKLREPYQADFYNRVIYGCGRALANAWDAFRRALSRSGRGGCIDVVLVVCFGWGGICFFLSSFLQTNAACCKYEATFASFTSVLSTSSLTDITKVGIIIFPYLRTYPTGNGPLRNHCAPKGSQHQSILRPSFPTFYDSKPTHNRTQPNSNICRPRTETRPGDVPSTCPHRVDINLPYKNEVVNISSHYVLPLMVH